MPSYNWDITLGNKKYKVYCQAANLGGLKLWINNLLVHDAANYDMHRAISIRIDDQEVLLVAASYNLIGMEYDLAVGTKSLTNGREIPGLVSGKISKRTPASVLPVFTSDLTTSDSGSASNTNADTENRSSIMTELQKIAALLEKGLIDEDEYKALKKKIIDKT